MRVRIAEGNPVSLNPASVGTPKNSDKLFEGIFSKNILIHNIELEIDITASAGSVTDASLGYFTLKSSLKGDFPKIPLRFLYKIFPYMSIPVKETAITDGKRYHIPIPFGLIAGIRPKDTALIPDRDNIYFEYYGVAEGGVTYSKHQVIPIYEGEASAGVDIPSEGKLFYTSDTIPANVDFIPNTEIKGATWMAFTKSDYSDFVEDKFKMFIDGVCVHAVNDIRRLNRIYARQRQTLGTHKAVDDIPDSIILVPVSMDKKMAKISASSEFIIQIQTGTSYTLQIMYQRLQRLDEQQSLRVAQQQNPAVTIQPNLIPVPVGADGEQRVTIKPIYRKLVKTASTTDLSKGQSRILAQ